MLKRDLLKSSLGDTYFYDFEVLEMEIELDKMVFTAEVKKWDILGTGQLCS